MGELIRDLGTFKIGDSSFQIEQNNPNSRGCSRSIHLQNQHGRLELTEEDFIRVAITMVSSAQTLRRVKGVL